MGADWVWPGVVSSLVRAVGPVAPPVNRAASATQSTPAGSVAHVGKIGRSASGLAARMDSHAGGAFKFASEQPARLGSALASGVEFSTEFPPRRRATDRGQRGAAVRTTRAKTCLGCQGDTGNHDLTAGSRGRS
jgi:hypothetical protein